MQIKILLLQRKESYPGQFAPEAVAVVDEVSYHENLGDWEAEVRHQKELVGTDADAWGELTVVFPDDVIIAALYPKVTVAAGRLI
jgi:hypothetical protein